MKLLTFIMLAMPQLVYSGMLLVPTPQLSAHTYFDWCLRENYSCTTDVFITDIKNKKATAFNKLMDNVDLNSETFNESFRNSILHILNTEDLDISQLHMLLALFAEHNAKYPSLLMKMLENELIRLSDIVESSTAYDKASFVFIFKKPISIEAADKIKTNLVKIPIYLINYNSVPVKTDSASFKRVIRKPLLNGSCRNYTLDSTLKINNWTVLHEKSCVDIAVEKPTREVRY
ncbi:MAG: hypothetical protein ABL930_07060 [Pseudobdellovibrio sp.]